MNPHKALEATLATKWVLQVQMMSAAASGRMSGMKSGRTLVRMSEDLWGDGVGELVGDEDGDAVGVEIGEKSEKLCLLASNTLFSGFLAMRWRRR